jgi:hypothetical protein
MQVCAWRVLDKSNPNTPYPCPPSPAEDAIFYHCCPVDGGYDSSITLQDKGFRCVFFGGTLNSI